ncbi:uncharacterized protein LOC144162612 [Haemaphysalis longicornis]
MVPWQTTLSDFERDYEYSDYSFSRSTCSSSSGDERSDTSEPDANQPGSGTTHHPEIAGLFKDVLSRKLVVLKGDILLMVLKRRYPLNGTATGLEREDPREPVFTSSPLEKAFSAAAPQNFSGNSGVVQS